MITTENTFERYTHECNISVSTLKDRLSILNDNRDFLVKRLRTYSGLFKQLNIDLDKLLGKVFNKFDLIGIKDADVLTYLYVLIEVSAEIESIKRKREVIEKRIVDKVLFKLIIKKFNTKSKDWMYRGGFYLRIRGAGVIGIRTIENKEQTKRINWGESNKKKAEIIASGRIPYASIKDEQGKIVGNNGGVDWLTYQSKRFDVWWYWAKSMSKLPNTMEYSFTPTKQNVTALSEIVREDSAAYLKYVTDKTHRINRNERKTS